MEKIARRSESAARQQRQEAREQLITAMLEGRTFQQVSTGSPVPLKRAMAYRLLRAVRTKGEIALQDGRHGHPSKLRGAVRMLLEERCRQDPRIPSAILQAELCERFDLSVSISQINRVRAALGCSNRSAGQNQEKNGPKQSPSSSRVAGRRRESVVARRSSAHPPPHVL